jgi:hypothetical protein
MSTPKKPEPAPVSEAEVLRRMLNTPPTPFTPKAKKKVNKRVK